jgi:transposase-like protein
MARPTKFGVALADDICRRLANGETLGAICRHHDITSEVVRQWREKHREFGTAYALAREHAADSLADEARELLAKAKPKDMVDVALLREKVQHLRWLAKALNPRRYGERTQVDSAFGGAAVSLVAALQAMSRPSGLAAPVIDGEACDIRVGA